MLVLTKNGEIKEKYNYKLKSISSRGNGKYGLQLNPHALSGVIVNYPESFSADKLSFLKDENDQLPDELEMRGEAVIPKNEHTYKKYGKDAVWRNIASGMFNRIVPFNLSGLLTYLDDEYNGLISNNYNSSTYSIKLIPKFEGRKCATPEIYESVKLIASLFEGKKDVNGKDFKQFKRGDSLEVYTDYSVKICYNDGEIRIYDDDPEELDIVMYSMSKDGSNIDLNDLNCCKELNEIGFKTIRDVGFEKNADYHLRAAGYGTTFRITSDKKSIHDAVNEFYGICPEIDKERWCQEFPRLRNMYEYACDGVVIKPVGSNKNTQKTDLRLGRNNKIVSPEYPADQIAIKLLSEVVRVKLDHIEYNETKIGNKTCTGILDKGYRTESGAVVSSINLHNPEWLSEHSWIKEGEEYDMCMALDIIPTLMNPNL